MTGMTANTISRPVPSMFERTVSATAFRHELGRQATVSTTPTSALVVLGGRGLRIEAGVAGFITDDPDAGRVLLPTLSDVEAHVDHWMDRVRQDARRRAR